MNQLFYVTAEEIARLNSHVFTDVLNHLLRAEGDRIGVPSSRIHTTYRINVPDGGIDARVEASAQTQWVPLGLSVWQFKSGRVPTDTTLRNGFDSPGVQEAFRAGGVYRVVVSASLNDPERLKALKVIQDCCHDANISVDRVDLLTADHVAQWAMQHPAMRLLLGGPLPGDLYRWEHWASNRRFTQPFKSDPQRSGIIAEIRRGLTDTSGPIRVGIVGLAGIGKSRLALEALRPNSDDDGLSELVLYADSPSSIPGDLFSWMEVTPKAELVLVVDECEGQDVERLEMQALRSRGRMRLITIGQAREARLYDPDRPNSFLLEKLSNEAMGELLRTATPGLPDAAYDFAVRIASGYVKLAVRLAEAMLRRPEKVSVLALALDGDVREVITKFLVTDDTDRRVMRALALMSRVGWEGEVQQEGQAVIKHLDLNWNEALSRVRRLTDEGIVAKQGRYRYVTPHILAVWLASEVWQDLGEQTILILKDLPFPTSGRAFLERLRDIGDDPNARQVCEMLLGPEGLFPGFSTIDDEGRAQAFSLLAETHPNAGLSALQRLLDGLSRDELLQFRVGRRQIVELLEKLVWLPETFLGAGRILLAFAESENESWVNNATGIWVGLFGTWLGNTAVPALQRHVLIEEALSSHADEQQLLAVRAISRIFAIQETGSVEGEQQGGRIAPSRWTPKTWDGDRQVRLSGIALLDRALASDREVVREAAQKVLFDHARQMTRLNLIDELMERLESQMYSNDEERRKVLNTVGSILEFDSDHLMPQQHTRLETFCNLIEGRSFGERLHLWTGDFVRRGRRRTSVQSEDSVEQDAKTREQESAALADEAMNDPNLLQNEWDWLGSASFSYFFARRLGELDNFCQFWGDIEALVRQGKGHAVAGGYIQGQSEAGRDWRGEVIQRWMAEGEGMALALMDLIWRGEQTDAEAQILVTLVNHGWIEGARLGAFTFSSLSRTISITSFLLIARSVLNDPSDAATSSAIGLLDQRSRLHPEDHSVLAPLVWDALERPKALLGDGPTGEHEYRAMDLALRYVADAPLRVARLVLELFNGSAPPLIRGNTAVKILEEATRADPKGVWAEVAPWLVGPWKAKRSVALYLCLQNWYGQIVGGDVLIPWAQHNLPGGPHIVAALTQVKADPLHLAEQGVSPIEAFQPSPLDPLVRELLIHFPNDNAVGATLASNFTHGTFWGKLSGWLQSHLEIAKGWLDDPDPVVQSWATNLVQRLKRQIEQITAQEEEEFF